ncbi:hypothetical protein L1049_009485 [Liquidambar formosana]|uniref:MACPF domain-containing protein n=1 Tax=Liquidambar formosana TaxID=63359 RepID=A0AAP0XA05_LIQFO
MGEKTAALHTAFNAIQALGRGFDVNFDTRLLYCKGVAGSRVVEVDEEHTRDLWLYDSVVVPNVSRDFKNTQETVGRESSGVCTFDEMVGYFNRKADLSENFPLGSFNSAFSFTGSKHIDAAATKTLSMDGFFLPLARVQLIKSSLMLQENVKEAVPTWWDPPLLASFIENFGTHVITSVTIGGKDVIYVKQHQSSPLSTMEIKNYVQDIGNHRELILTYLTAKGYTLNLPMLLILLGKRMLQSFSDEEEEMILNKAITNGQKLSSPLQMSLRCLSSLSQLSLMRLTGKEHLDRAIGLYLEYKPQIEELRYFLEFQIPRIWAPVHDKLPGHQRKEPVCPSLQFSLMGQKLYVSQEQVSVGRKPVTGLRLCLGGSKQNRLCIHLQHLASLPKILQPYWDTHVAIGAPKWQGPEEQDSRWFEPVKWKNFSHVSTAPIENLETSIGDLSGVYIVTGAQLGVWDFGSRNVLYMKLLYSRLPGCTIRRSLWDHTPNDKSRKLVVTGTNAGDSSSGSRENSVANKLAKFVDTSEMSKGPQDPPGHWLVTGGKLGVEKGKIVLRVKYSLLNY